MYQSIGPTVDMNKSKAFRVLVDVFFSYLYARQGYICWLRYLHPCLVAQQCLRIPEPLPAYLAKLQINFGELLQAIDFPSEDEFKRWMIT